MLVCQFHNNTIYLLVYPHRSVCCLYVGLSLRVCRCVIEGKKKRRGRREEVQVHFREGEREREEKKGSQIIRYKVIVTVHTYMHSYHNKFEYLQNYTRFNMCIFYIILCKFLHILYFRLTNTSALVLKFYSQYLHSKSHIHNPKPPPPGEFLPLCNIYV